MSFDLLSFSDLARSIGTPTSNGLSTSDKIALGTSISFGLPGLLVLLGGIWKKQRIRGTSVFEICNLDFTKSMFCSLVEGETDDKCVHPLYLIFIISFSKFVLQLD